MILRSPGIDSQPGGPVLQPYLTYRAAMQATYRLAESIPWNRFLDSLNIYKFVLRNRSKGVDSKESLKVYKFGLCILTIFRDSHMITYSLPDAEPALSIQARERAQILPLFIWVIVAPVGVTATRQAPSLIVSKL